MKVTIPLHEAKVGDVVLDERLRTVRVLRTTKYRAAGVAVVRGVVTEAAAPTNRFTVVVNFPEGLRARNGQYINVDR
jgi:hypothetical protein